MYTNRNMCQMWSSAWSYCSVNICSAYLVCYCIWLTHCGLMTPYGDRDLAQTLAQAIACCLTAPSHYLNQCWLIISEVQWHSYLGNFTRDASTINHWNLKITCLKFHPNFPRANELICYRTVMIFSYPLPFIEGCCNIGLSKANLNLISSTCINQLF